MPLSLQAARAEFDPQVTFLNTASLGLPPLRALTAMQAALADWRAGRAEPMGYDVPLESARASYAAMVGVPDAQVAVGSQVSVFAGVIAASLPAGSEVLVAEGEFTSITFPFFAQAGRGVTVREVPLESIAAEVRPTTTLVSVSAVQSSDGRLADLDALESACAVTGSRVLLDVTQAAGWLPIAADRFAYTVCGAYKWLLCPRGVAFLTVRPELWDELVPAAAGWYAGEAPWSSIYGSPLRLASSAHRFDLSPVWLAWVAAGPTLTLLNAVGVDAIHRHSLGLARRFLDGIGLPSGDSAIVSIAASDGAADALAEAGIVGATRAGRLRLSFYLYNDAHDVDRAVDVVGALRA